MSGDFEIEVTVRGPSFQRDTNFGPRDERKDYARFQVPIAPAAAWSIYEYAIRAARSPQVSYTDPWEPGSAQPDGLE